MRNLQKQVKKAFCYQKLFWPFTVWINCSSDLKIFANSRPSATNFKSFSRSLELPKWPKTANPFYEFGSRCISESFISVDTDRTSTPCVCLYWNSVSLTLPPSCTVSRNLWIVEFHALMKFLDSLASKSQTSYDPQKRPFSKLPQIMTIKK